MARSASISSAETVRAWRDAWSERARELLCSLGLPVALDVAADPFFGRGGKLLAASRVGIDTVVIPKRNEKDLEDVPEEVRATLGIHLVDTIDEALALTLDTAAESTPVSA